MKYILLFLALFVASASAQIKKREWVAFGITHDKVVYAYDTNNVKKKNDSTVSVWVRIGYGRDSITSVRWRIYKERNNDDRYLKNYSYTVNRLEIECNKEKFRIVKLIDYNTNNDVIEDYPQDELEEIDILPDSITATLFNKFCSQ